MSDSDLYNWHWHWACLAHTLSALRTAVNMLSCTACWRTPLACLMHSAKWSSICSLSRTQKKIRIRNPQVALGKQICHCTVQWNFLAAQSYRCKRNALRNKWIKIKMTKQTLWAHFTCVWRRREGRPHQTGPLRHQWRTRPKGGAQGWPRPQVRVGRWRRGRAPGRHCLRRCWAAAVRARKTTWWERITARTCPTSWLLVACHVFIWIKKLLHIYTIKCFNKFKQLSTPQYHSHSYFILDHCVLYQ